MSDVSLREYVDGKFEAQDKAVSAALVAAEKATVTALAAAEKAVDKAETGNQKWRESANEWRGAMSDRERDFLTRKEFYAIVGTAVAVVGLVFAFAR